MKWNIDIERIHEVPNVLASSQGLDDFEISVDDRKIVLDAEILDAYNEVFRKETTFGHRFKKFLTAENRAGRQAKILKDFLLIFVPYGEKIETLTDMITKIIEDSMPTEKEKKKMRQSSQLVTFFVLFVLSLVSYLGVDLGFEVSQDAEIVGIISSILGIIFRVITNQPVQVGEELRNLLGRPDE